MAEGDQTDVDVARAQARSLADLGDFAGAREALSRALDQAASNAELHAMMAWVTSRCTSIDPHERDRLAQHHLGVAFEVAPESPHPHHYQGLILVEQGNAQRASHS